MNKKRMLHKIASWLLREDLGGSAGMTPTGSMPITIGQQLRVYTPGVTGADTCQSIATAYRCVQLLADSVASLRMQFMRVKDGRYQEDENSSLHYLLTYSPQMKLSAYQFWKGAVEQMLLLGNAYIYPRWIDGVIEELVLCAPYTVCHNGVNGTYTISDTYNGVSGVFGESDIIHLYVNSTDGITGRSVIDYAAVTMGIARSGDGETLNRFMNGGTVRGLVTNDKQPGLLTPDYDDDEMGKAAMDIDSRLNGGQNIVSIPGQVDFKQLSMSSADMQFLESRKFTVREICRFFGVHPSFVFDDTSNNYKSAEMANVAFMTNTLNPILRMIECEFNRKLVPRSLCCKRRFAFDRHDVYSLDLAGKAAYQKSTIETGIYTVNDWRRKENQPLVDGGDTVYLSTNLAALGSEKLSGITNNDNNG